MVASIAQWAFCGVLLAALADLSVAIEDMEAMIVAATEPLRIVTELDSLHPQRCTFFAVMLRAAPQCVAVIILVVVCKRHVCCSSAVSRHVLWH